jgi:hypothetical protein
LPSAELLPLLLGPALLVDLLAEEIATRALAGEFCFYPGRPGLGPLGALTQGSERQFQHLDCMG